jgi:hypothetical protein
MASAIFGAAQSAADRKDFRQLYAEMAVVGIRSSPDSTQSRTIVCISGLSRTQYHLRKRNLFQKSRLHSSIDWMQHQPLRM